MQMSDFGWQLDVKYGKTTGHSTFGGMPNRFIDFRRIPVILRRKSKRMIKQRVGFQWGQFNETGESDFSKRQGMHFLSASAF